MWRDMYKNHFGGPADMGGYKVSLISNFVAMQDIVKANDRLVWATIHGHYNAVRVLLSTTNADVNYIDPVLKGSCLHLASGAGHAEVVKELLIHGARVNDCGNMVSETPLQVACKHGYIQVVAVLIANKADVNALDKYGRSALHKAAYEGRTEVVKFLLRTPSINAELEEMCYGQTALHIACARNQVDIARLLLRANSNINAVDLDGWTPLHLACFKGNKAVVTALLSHDAGALVGAAQESRWGETRLTYNLHASKSFGEKERDLAALFSNTVK
jgi:ankyrin repeat protein